MEAYARGEGNPPHQENLEIAPLFQVRIPRRISFMLLHLSGKLQTLTDSARAEEGKAYTGPE